MYVDEIWLLQMLPVRSSAAAASLHNWDCSDLCCIHPCVADSNDGRCGLLICAVFSLLAWMRVFIFAARAKALQAACFSVYSFSVTLFLFFLWKTSASENKV